MGLIDTWEEDPFVQLDYFCADRASTYQGKMFRWINFLRQSVYLSGQLFTFLRSTVALSGAYLIAMSHFTSNHERNDWQFLLWSVFFLWEVHPFMVFPYKVWGNKQFCYNLTAILFLAFLEWSLLKRSFFRLFCFARIAKNLQQCLFWTEMLKLLENCGTSVTKKNLSRHKLRCSGGTLYSSERSNFSTDFWDDSDYHIAKKTQCSKTLKNLQVWTMSSGTFQFSCLTSTRKHSTLNTKWNRSEQYWCGEHSGWRSKFERRFGVLQTLFDRYWNEE